MIFSLWKPIGRSTHLFVKSYGDRIGERITHTGSLDPMAEGVVVVLTGEDRFLKEKYSNSDKEYEFEILIGVSTDSHDLLGLINDQYKEDCSVQLIVGKLGKILSDFIGTFKQAVPDFSAKRIKGKSFFDLAKRGEKLPEISERVTIQKLEISGCYIRKKEEILEQIEEKIHQVQGNFRQEEILISWRRYFKNDLKPGTEIKIVKLTAITSKRTYIRGLVRDLSELLKTPMLTYSIIRTRNGDYTKGDCINLKS